MDRGVMEVHAEGVSLSEETPNLPWVVKEGCQQEVALCTSLKDERGLARA